MTYVSIAIMVLTHLIFVIMPARGEGRLSIFSAYNIFFLSYFFYIILPAFLFISNDQKFVWAPGFADDTFVQYTCLVATTGLIAFVMGDFVGKKVSSKSIHNQLFATVPDSAKYSLFFPYMLIAIGVALKIYYVYSQGGFEKSILQLSFATRSDYGLSGPESSSIGIRTLSGIADAGATWLLVQALKGGQRRALSVSLFSMVMVISYFTIGKRLALLWPLLAVGCAYHLYISPLTIKKAPRIGLLIVIFGLSSLMFRIFLPAKMANVDIDLNNIEYARGSIWAFYFYSLEFSTFEMLTVVTQVPRQINEMFGGAFDSFIVTSLEPFTYAIPRAIWIGKPTDYYDLSHAVSALINGYGLEAATVGYAITILGTSYVYGGIGGVVLFLFILGLLSGICDRAWRRANWTAGNVIFYGFWLMVMFHLFRQGTLGWVFIICVMQQYGFLLGTLLMMLWQVPKKLGVKAAMGSGKS